MLKRINGKCYDTRNSKRICTKESIPGISEFLYMREELYVKSNGEYFIYAVGGHLTKYTTPEASAYMKRASKIIPVSEEEAKNFARLCMDEEEYRAAFKSDDFNMKQLRINLDNSSYARLLKEAAKRNLTPAELIRGILNEL